jgi:hypothetical protein
VKQNQVDCHFSTPWLSCQLAIQGFTTAPQINLTSGAPGRTTRCTVWWVVFAPYMASCTSVSTFHVKLRCKITRNCAVGMVLCLQSIGCCGWQKRCGSCCDLKEQPEPNPPFSTQSHPHSQLQSRLPCKQAILCASLICYTPHLLLLHFPTGQRGAQG